MNRRRAQGGFTLVSVAVASVIGLTAAYGFYRSAAASGRKLTLIRNKLIAENYAAELLEFFRSQTPLQLKGYLGKNPVTGTTTPATLYKLCTLVNILDRTAGLTLNADPLAGLAPEVLPADSGPGSASNRFYQVQVVNTSTLVARADLCSVTPAEIFLPGETVPAGTPAARILSVNETFLVTVGVSWESPLTGGRAENRIVVSTLLPQ